MLVTNIPLAVSESEEVIGIEGSVVKVCQLVADFDKERNQSTISMTFRRYGVGGTDLGFSFEHKGKSSSYLKILLKFHHFHFLEKTIALLILLITVLMMVLI